MAVSVASVLAFVAFLNAAAYIAYAGNPLVTSDAWYFIDAFLQRALDAGPDLADFFVKRGGMDHAQPLVKLLLLLNARWLGLDFVFEALMGLGFAIAAFTILAVGTWSDARQAQPAWLHGLLLGALAAVLVTFNSGLVFSWSLVTLGYIYYAFAACGAVLAWRAMTRRRYGALLVGSVLIAFLLDDVGLLISAALIVSLALAAARTGRWRTALIAIGLVGLSELAYMVVSHAYLHSAPVASAGGGVATNIQRMWLLRTEALEIARIVLATTFAHVDPLTYYFPGAATRIQSWLAITALLAHGWFWWRAGRGIWNAPVFFAVAMMLLFYAMVAGIVYARVPEYGVNYLHDPRYAGIYLLANVALVLMLLGQPLGAGGTAARTVATVALSLLLALQVLLANFTWYQATFLATYYHRMAREMVVLGEGKMPESCVPILTVCKMPPEEREAAMLFLQQHHLNIYSPDFVSRYGLQKLMMDTPAPAR